MHVHLYSIVICHQQSLQSDYYERYIYNLLAIKAKIQCQVTRRDWRFENLIILIVNNTE